jgi:hypothetical protein
MAACRAGWPTDLSVFSPGEYSEQHKCVMMRKLKIVALVAFLQMGIGASYLSAQTEQITRQETLRGSVTPEREWWDVLHYHLQVEFLPGNEKIERVEHDNFQDAKAGKQNAD